MDTMSTSGDIFSARQHIENVMRERRLHGRRTRQKIKNSEDLEIALKVLSEELQRWEPHFLLELIRNADEAKYESQTPSFSLTLKEQHLRTDCNETGFTKADVDAICCIGSVALAECARDAGEMDEKSIGFRSVFKAATAVWISSGHYTFKFDRTAPLGMVTPIWEAFPDGPPIGGTSMYLKLPGIHNKEDIRQKMGSFDARMLVFLRKLEEVRLSDHGSDQKTQRVFRRTKVGDDVEILENGNVILRYRMFRHRVRYMPSESTRPNVTESHVQLAFPIVDHRCPASGINQAYASLPIRDYGFKFLINADFLLSANREGINGSQWNQRLVESIPAVFAAAVQHLNGTDMRFAWPRYVPLWGELLADFQYTEDKIERSLRCKPILESEESERLKQPRSLFFVPESLRFGERQPLTLNENTRSKYLSRKYPDDSFRFLRALGVRRLRFEEFLEDLQAQFAMRTDEAKHLPQDWHVRLADVLNNGLKESSHRRLVLELRIVPLRDGRWVSANECDGKFFFPATDATKGIPADLSIAVIDPDALESSSRREMFRRMGAKPLNDEDICTAIMRQHTSLASADGLPAASLISHAHFLFRSSCRIPPEFDIWVVTKEGRRYWASNVYSKSFPVAGGELPVLHQAYNEAAAWGRQSDWDSWAATGLRVWSIPRLVDATTDGFRLSRDMDRIRREWPSSRFLVLLRDNWNTYRIWLDRARASGMPPRWSASRRTLKKTLASTPVTCLNTADRHGLGQTVILPSGAPCVAELANYYSILDVPEPDHASWLVLRHLGVRVGLDAKIYVDALVSARNWKRSGDYTWAYEGLRSLRLRDGMAVGQAFSEHRLVFVPSTKFRESEWVSTEDCIWSGPNFLRRTPVLREIYPSCGALFEDFLRIPSANAKAIVAEARAIEVSDPRGYIVQVFSAIDEHASRDENGRMAEAIASLRDCEIFPIELERYGEGREGSHCLVSWTSAYEWFISDHPRLRDCFASKLPLLAFDTDELENMKWIYSLPGIEKRLLSKVVACRPRPGLRSTVHDAYTALVRTMADCIALLVPNQPSLGREEALAQLERARVYCADNLEMVWIVTCAGGEARSVPVHSSGVACSERNRIRIYLDSTDVDSANMPLVVAGLLSEYFGIPSDLLAALRLVLADDDGEDEEEKDDDDEVDIDPSSAPDALVANLVKAPPKGNWDSMHQDPRSPSTVGFVEETTDNSTPESPRSPVIPPANGPFLPNEANQAPVSSQPKGRKRCRIPSLWFPGAQDTKTMAQVPETTSPEQKKGDCVSPAFRSLAPTPTDPTSPKPFLPQRQHTLAVQTTFPPEQREDGISPTSRARAPTPTGPISPRPPPPQLQRPLTVQTPKTIGEITESLSRKDNIVMIEDEPGALARLFRFHGSANMAGLRGMAKMVFVPSTNELPELSSGSADQQGSRVLPARLILSEFGERTVFIARESRSSVDSEPVFLGEAFISRKLGDLLGGEYDPGKHWTSPMRTRLDYAAFEPRGQASAAFTIGYGGGCGRKLNDFLFRNSYRPVLYWENHSQTYHIEVHTTFTGLESPFILRSSTLDMARKFRLSGSARTPKDVFIIARIYNIGQEPGVALFVDPWALYSDNRLNVKFQDGHTTGSFQNIRAGEHYIADPRWTVKNERGFTWRIYNSITRWWTESLAPEWPARMYEWRPLRNSKKNIRILHLLPGKPGDRILRGTLNEVVLDPGGGNPTFHAISYAWCSGLKQFYLETPGGRIPLTASLYFGLKRLRRRDKEICLWADAVCIDQGKNGDGTTTNQEDEDFASFGEKEVGEAPARARPDNTIIINNSSSSSSSSNREKEHQISLMGNIFRSAASVYIWLGENRDRSQKAIKFLMKNGPKKSHPGQHDGEKPGATPGMDNSVWSSIIYLLERKWFRRVWVAQELVLAKKAVVVCGDQEMPWDQFYHAVEDCFENKGLPKKGKAAAILKLGRFRSRYPRCVDGTTKDEDFSLLSLLEQFHRSKASRQRDKLFALLNLASDGKHFHLDYEKRLENVVTEFGRVFVRMGKAMELLYRAKAAPPSPPSRFPSWVPDWTLSPYPGSISTWPEKTKSREYAAAVATGLDPPGLEPPPDGSVLTMHGWRIDSIKHIGKCALNPNSSKLYLEEIFRTVNQVYGSRGFTGEAISEIQCQLPIGNACRGSGDEWIGDLSECYRELSGYLEECRKAEEPRSQNMSEYWNYEQPSLTGQQVELMRPYLSTAREFAEMFSTATTAAVVCVTEGERVGIVPRTAQAGDSIVLFAGSKVPFIIRRRQDPVPGDHGQDPDGHHQVPDDPDEDLAFGDQRQDSPVHGEKSSLGQDLRDHRGEGLRDCYEFIGECYLHGVMYGEAFQRLSSSGSNEPGFRQFRLR